MPEKESWYCWKEFASVENEEPRLLTPWSDPNVYEFEMDWLFHTPEEAKKAKHEHAPYENWHLVKMTLEPIEFVKSEELNDDDEEDEFHG